MTDLELVVLEASDVKKFVEKKKKKWTSMKKLFVLIYDLFI